VIVLNPTTSSQPPSIRERFALHAGCHIVSLARGESLVRRDSILLSLADNRPSLAHRRTMIERAVADHIAAVVNLGSDHGIDILANLYLDDLKIVSLALAPLKRKEAHK
jgi:hypothetical protein